MIKVESDDLVVLQRSVIPLVVRSVGVVLRGRCNFMHQATVIMFATAEADSTHADRFTATASVTQEP